MARRISIFASPELQAVRATTRALPADVAKVLNRETRKEVGPLWQGAVRERVRTRLQSKVLGDTATASVTRLNVLLNAAKKGAPLSGGGRRQRLWIGAEFGAGNGQDKWGRSLRKRFGPRNTNPGKVIYPAAYEVVPKVGAIWAKNTAAVVADAFDV